jgi:hypothetical protein
MLALSGRPEHTGRSSHLGHYLRQAFDSFVSEDHVIS